VLAARNHGKVLTMREKILFTWTVTGKRRHFRKPAPHDGAARYLARHTLNQFATRPIDVAVDAHPISWAGIACIETCQVLSSRHRSGLAGARLNTAILKGAMSFLDNLENDLKALESRTERDPAALAREAAAREAARSLAAAFSWMPTAWRKVSLAAI